MSAQYVPGSLRAYPAVHAEAQQLMNAIDEQHAVLETTTANRHAARVHVALRAETSHSTAVKALLHE